MAGADTTFRLLLFSDPTLATSVALLAAALRAAEDRPYLEVVGIVDTARNAPGRGRLAREVSTRLARRACNPRGPSAAERPPLLTSPASLAKRHGIPFFAPRQPGVNDAAFVDLVRDRLRPDAALALMVAQIFRPPLMAAVKAAANYHDGTLPAYRGVGATEWSVYHGDRESGFTYHRMSERVDEGPIILQDAVPVAPRSGPAAVERAKTDLAATRIGEALDLLFAGYAGRPQTGEASLFTRSDIAAIRDVGDPSTLTWDELERRLRAFQQIELTLAGERWEVTALRQVGRRPRHPTLAFTTADGLRAEPARCVHLPLTLYRAYRPRRAIAEAA